MWVLSWIFFGFIVGLIAKFIFPGDLEPKGCLVTVGIGIAGSFVGGALGSLLTGSLAFAPSGIISSIIGSIVLLYLYQRLNK